MEYNTFYPNAIFANQYGNCPTVNFSGAVAVGTNNNLLVTAVTGSRIVVVSYNVLSAGAADTLLTFKSASGGTNIYFEEAPANTKTPNKGIFNPCGHFETIVSQGLYVDCGAGASAYISLRYFTYVP